MEMIQLGKRIREIMGAIGYKNRATFYKVFKRTFKRTSDIFKNDCRKTLHNGQKRYIFFLDFCVNPSELCTNKLMTYFQFPILQIN